MNHCRDCNSDYAMPGTCNCFAVGGKRHVAAPAPAYVPWAPTISPNYPQTTYPQIWWGVSDRGVTGATTTISAETIERLREQGLVTYTR